MRPQRGCQLEAVAPDLLMHLALALRSLSRLQIRAAFSAVITYPKGLCGLGRWPGRGLRRLSGHRRRGEQATLPAAAAARGEREVRLRCGGRLCGALLCHQVALYHLWLLLRSTHGQLLFPLASSDDGVAPWPIRLTAKELRRRLRRSLRDWEVASLAARAAAAWAFGRTFFASSAASRSASFSAAMRERSLRRSPVGSPIAVLVMPRVRVLGVLASQQAGGVRILALLPHGLAPRDLVRLGFGHNPTRLGQHCGLRVDSDRLNGVPHRHGYQPGAGTIGRAVITRCREGFIDGCQDAHALLAVSLDGVQQKQLVMVHRRQRVHHIRHVERGDGAQFCSQLAVGATAAGIGDSPSSGAGMIGSSTEDVRPVCAPLVQFPTICAAVALPAAQGISGRPRHRADTAQFCVVLEINDLSQPPALWETVVPRFRRKAV
ncbi:hypothetical protein SNK04_014167 [Fusarium graminearum]